MPGSSAPTTFYSKPPELLCTFTSERAMPITLLISAESNTFASSPNLPRQFFLPANLGADGSSYVTRRTGVLLLEYGAGAARNYVCADLKPGAYALPVCDYAQVSVVHYHPLGSIPSPLPAINVGGTFLEGQHRNPARLTSSLVIDLAAGAQISGLVPAHARWVDIEGGHIGDGEVSAGGKIRFLEETTVMGNYGVGRYIVRDAAAAVYVPDQLPAELVGGQQFRIWNDGAAMATIATRFFLEL